jgi:hypothetical protein
VSAAGGAGRAHPATAASSPITSTADTRIRSDLA